MEGDFHKIQKCVVASFNYILINLIPNILISVFILHTNQFKHDAITPFLKILMAIAAGIPGLFYSLKSLKEDRLKAILNGVIVAVTQPILLLFNLLLIGGLIFGDTN